MGTIDKVLQVLLACVLATAVAALSACGTETPSPMWRAEAGERSIVFRKTVAARLVRDRAGQESTPQQLPCRASGVDENRTVRLFPAFAGA